MNSLVRIFTFLSVLFLLASCKNDIRNKYVGDWQFVVEMKKINTDSIGQFCQDTVCYIGEICKTSNDKEIEIRYTEEHSISLYLDELGKLYGFPTTYCNGKFDNENKIYLYLRWGGLGGNVTHVINGTRKP
ncbi:MAG: hypothetical protein E7065_11440 [Lentimicrobiaceae bacterium]|nr:hypothetical protein [Lentimicrobiaceae bacterium]